MAGIGPGQAGADILMRRHVLAVRRRHLPGINCFGLLMADTPVRRALGAVLRGIWRYRPEVCEAETLGAAIDLVMQRRPEVVFLGDALPPRTDAGESLQFLQHCDAAARVVVITHRRASRVRAALAALGASDVVSSDDIEGGRIALAVERCLAHSTVAAE